MLPRYAWLIALLVFWTIICLTLLYYWKVTTCQQFHNVSQRTVCRYSNIYAKKYLLVKHKWLVDFSWVIWLSPFINLSMILRSYQTNIVYKQIYHYWDFVFFFIFSTENIFSAHQLIISAHWIHTSRVKCIFNTREEDVHEKINSA